MLNRGRPLVRTPTLRSTILILWSSALRSGRYVSVPHSGPQRPTIRKLTLPSDYTVHNQPLVRHQSNLDGVFNELRNNTQTNNQSAVTRLYKAGNYQRHDRFSMLHSISTRIVTILLHRTGCYLLYENFTSFLIDPRRVNTSLSS